MRIGHGVDVHALVEGRALILCGVRVPHDKGLLGHSDADVAAHALMDALLGAAALGDIGKLFPDTDAKYKDISSLVLLDEVMRQVAALGFRPVNIDITIVGAAPEAQAVYRRDAKPPGGTSAYPRGVRQCEGDHHRTPGL